MNLLLFSILPYNDQRVPYDDSINTTSEPELNMKEDTAVEVTAKTAAEDKKEAELKVEKEKDYGGGVMRVRISSKNPGFQTMTEETYDERLSGKIQRLDQDEERLKKKLEEFNDIVVVLKKQQKIVEGKENEKLFSGAIRPAAGYLKSTRRRKKSGRRGKAGGRYSASHGKT